LVHNVPKGGRKRKIMYLTAIFLPLKGVESVIKIQVCVRPTVRPAVRPNIILLFFCHFYLLFIAEKLAV